MSATDDLIETVCARLEKLIATQTKNLIGGTRDDHDRIAGRILGLREACDEIRKLAGQWRMRDDEGEG